MIWTAEPWEIENHYQRTGKTEVTRGVTYYAPIPGCPFGSQYVISQLWDGRWDVGATLRRWDGSYWTGADRLYSGQPTHATARAAQEWTERRDHRRWARLMVDKARRANANVARGFLG